MNCAKCGVFVYEDTQSEYLEELCDECLEELWSDDPYLDELYRDIGEDVY